MNFSKHWPIHLGLIAFIGLAMYPILWVVALAFSGSQDLTLANLPADPTQGDHLAAALPFPERWSLANFSGLMRDLPFLQWMGNSLIVSGLTTLAGIVIACPAAYAFSRFRFPGQRAGLFLFLVSQMYPVVVMLAPLYVIVSEWLRLGDSLWGLMLVYAATAAPFCVWMLKGYFDTIPIEIEESAIMDGVSRPRIFWEIVLPLARPAIAVTALFSFMTAWNEFILAAIFLENQDKYTAPVGLRFLVSDYTADWGYFAAGSILVSLPVAALFFALQKNLVSGLSEGAVK
ncbi:MAG TPA: ABC transporter [Hyphomonadaceae bacterium]|nr:ABC transporter [Hyphomonadaceae bacterium]